jgi:hypothetical protein
LEGAEDVSWVAMKKKKTEGRHRGVRREVNEVIDVVRSAFHLLCKIYSKFSIDFLADHAGGEPADTQRLRTLFESLGEEMSKRSRVMFEQASYFHTVALDLLEQTKERFNEVAALQRRQNELLVILLRLHSEGQNSPLDGPVDNVIFAPEWADMLEREARAIHDANHSRFQFLNRLRLSSTYHRGADPVHLNTMNERAEARIQSLLEQARGMLQEDDARQHTASDMEMETADEDGPTVKMEAENYDEVLAQTEQEVEVPDALRGQVIDLTTDARADHHGEVLDLTQGPANASAGIIDLTQGQAGVAGGSSEPSSLPPNMPAGPSAPRTSTPPSNSQAGPHPLNQLPSAPAPSSPPPPQMAPAVNLVTATPQHSQDRPAGTVTTLIAPLPLPAPSRTRGRSRTPVPPMSPMITRSRSRTPAPDIAAPLIQPTSLLIPVPSGRPRSLSPFMGSQGGTKRKSPVEEDGANKKFKGQNE